MKIKKEKEEQSRTNIRFIPTVERLCTNNYQMATVSWWNRSQKAKDEELAYEEAEMVGVEAIELRRKYPTLRKAWDQYRVIWRLVSDND